MTKAFAQSLFELLGILSLILALILFLVPVLPFWIFLFIAIFCFYKFKKI